MTRAASTCTLEVRAEFDKGKNKPKQKEERITSENLKTSRKITRVIKIIACVEFLIIRAWDVDSEVSPRIYIPQDTEGTVLWVFNSCLFLPNAFQTPCCLKTQESSIVIIIKALKGEV